MHSETNSPEHTIDHACLFNLIVYTYASSKSEYFKEIVNLITQQFPCRIIFIEGNQNVPSNGKPSNNQVVTTQEISWNRISIEVNEKNLSRVPFLILPLLIPDLPIYLLWGQDPCTENTILPHLEKLATRLIFDSESTNDLQQFSLKLLEHIQNSHMQIVDMNWARTSGWREVLLQIYDSPERLEQLATANKIQLTYNTYSNNNRIQPETQAIYLQAWLASCLGWNWSGPKVQTNKNTLHYSSSKGNHEISFLPTNNASFSPEEILEIEIKGCKDYACNLKRKNDDDIEVKASNQYQCELPFTLLMPSLDSGKTLVEEMFYQKMSTQYLAMLQLISSIKWT